MHERDIKMPEQQEIEAKEDVHRREESLHMQEGGKSLTERRKRHNRERTQDGKKVHARERDSMCMCKKVLKINGKNKQESGITQNCKKL